MAVNKHNLTYAEQSLKENSSRFLKRRKTTLARISENSLERVRRFSKIRKETMTQSFDHIINKFFKHQKHYEVD